MQSVAPVQSFPAKPNQQNHARVTTSLSMFQFVPELGYREYWYPALLASSVGKRPKKVVMLGEELVFFRGESGKVVALWDRCPHRGALLSFGRCQFKGTISCPYHGYTYDENGRCVAALTEGPESAHVGKLRAKTFPTQEVRGIVFVWMGQTEPVPVQEDTPEELVNDDWFINPYVENWPMNWALTVENTADAHFSYVHRFSFRRFLNLENFRYLPAYWAGIKIVEEGKNYIGIKPDSAVPQQAYYPGVKARWPRYVWWRILKPQLGRPHSQGKAYHLEYRLPSIIRVDYVNRIHMRWPVPIDKETTRMFTFALYRARTPWQRFWARLHFRTIHWFFVIKGTNENEDVPVQRRDRLDPHAPQMLGRNDRAIIYWRRRMPWKSRDAERLWPKPGPGVTPEAEKQDADMKALMK